MSSTSATMTLNANTTTPGSKSGSSKGLEFTKAVMQKAHDVYRTKIAEEIAARTRCGLSTAYLWKRGDHPMTIGDFLSLLDSEEAVAFLEVFWDAVPMVARERWLKQELLKRRRDVAERKQAALQNEIQQLRFELGKR